MIFKKVLIIVYLPISINHNVKNKLLRKTK